MHWSVGHNHENNFTRDCVAVFGHPPDRSIPSRPRYTHMFYIIK